MYTADAYKLPALATLNAILNQQFSVNGVVVEISEELFAETFDLPVVGLADVSEMPKDKIFDARSIVSLSGEPVILSGSKSQMKMHYRLLCDIMAKSISVKDGSFNAITVEKFSLLTAVVCDVRMNWGSVLFGIFKNMVTPGTKQAKGFAIQISLLLKSIHNLELGESSDFPSSKILTDKTIQRYIAIIDKSGAQESADAPKVKKAPRTKVSSKKRPANTPLDVPVFKKKITFKKKSVTSLSTLEMVAVAQKVVPIQMIETFTVAPSAENISDQPAGETDGVKAVDADVDALTAKIDEQVADPSAIDETSVRECFEPAVEVPAEETRCSYADDVDFIIQQVIEETREVDASTDKNQPAATEERHWFDLPYEDLIEKWAAERPVVTASDTDEADVPMDVGTADGDQHVQCVEEKSAVNDDLLNADEQMSLDDIILTIPFDVPLPSSSMEITKIQMGEKIKIPEVTERTWFLNSLPSIPADHKGKEILVEKDPIKGNPAQEHYFLICADIDLLVALRAKVIDEFALFFNSFSLRKLATFNIEDMYKKEEQVLSWGETESPQVAIQRKLYILIKYREVLVWKFLQSWRANFVPGQGSSAVDLKVIELLSDLHLFILEELAKEARAHGLLWIKTCCSKIFEGSPGDRGAVIARTNTNTRSSCWIRTMIFVDGVWTVDHVLISGLFNWLPSADITAFLSSIALSRTAFRSAQISQNSVSVVPSVQFSLDQRPSSPISADNSSSLNFDASDLDAAVSSLPSVSPDISAALADFQAILSKQVNESQSGIASRLHKIEQVLRDSLCDQAALFKNVSQDARQEGRTIDDVQTPRFNEFRKHTLAQNASIFTGLADVRKEVQEVNAKVDILASRVNAVQKDVEATKEAISHQLLEFQSQAQENHNILHAQLSELVDYIHRGRADKKGESGSRGLQQPSNVQMSASAKRTPTFAQRVEIAQRHIVQTVLDADSNRELLERQAAAERDRERRRREARMLKRRRRD
ncbi:lysine-specific demethylase rbr-2 [Dorcoceras hygrometricum]|uniref:Lysine-specific demethylase rbr-2 n=1 Tax=Dorcoceras hygrometricum TaxID=472368 RepID=A0A2Z7D0U6_9LAMI|nr:lysine-specific demethylase rbr-2 [Dorcoceras hygrometricum]